MGLCKKPAASSASSVIFVAQWHPNSTPCCVGRQLESATRFLGVHPVVFAFVFVFVEWSTLEDPSVLKLNPAYLDMQMVAHCVLFTNEI